MRALNRIRSMDRSGALEFQLARGRPPIRFSTRHVWRLTPLARATNITGAQLVEVTNSPLEARRSASILSGTGRPSGGPVVASQRPLLLAARADERAAAAGAVGARNKNWRLHIRCWKDGAQWKARAWQQSYGPW